MTQKHDHIFGQDKKQDGETRTLIVIALTGVMMVVELVTGWLYGSMALLADGMHMGSHAAALSISAFAYIYARRRARDQRYSFGTGKVNALAGFSSAIILVIFALYMVVESIDRFINPVPIIFNQAILVSVIGLVVNALSVLILNQSHDHHDHDGRHDHDHHHHEDLNLRSAFLHVLADALTSLLAIFALLAGKYWGWNWMDPFMGLVGAALVSRWAYGLLRQTSKVLLDHQAPESLLDEVTTAVKSLDEHEILDLHAWQIGPGLFSLALSIAAADPLPPDEYKDMLPHNKGIVHVLVETHNAADKT